MSAGEVTVVGIRSWKDHGGELAKILGAQAKGSGGRYIAPRNPKAPRDDDDLATIEQPAYWAERAAELEDAIRRAPPPAAAGLVLGAPAAAPSAQPPERLTMTVEEAAAALGISRAFAYQAIRRGEIPCITIGRRKLIPRAALQRLLEADDGDASTEHHPS